MLMYHISPCSNRTSIQGHGLSCAFDMTGLGAVFLTTRQPGPTPGFDVWAVAVTGLPLEEDWSGEPPMEGELWWLCTADISEERLSLIS